MEDLLKKFLNNLQHIRGNEYALMFENKDGSYTGLTVFIRWYDNQNLFWFTHDNQTLCCPIAESCIYECFCWVRSKYC
jgi:hypothetical protein